MGPARFHCATLLADVNVKDLKIETETTSQCQKADAISRYSGEMRHKIACEEKKVFALSEVGFEPTPSDEDHDLNVAP